MSAPLFRFSQKTHKAPFFDYMIPETVELPYGIKLWLGEEINRNFQRACFAEFLALIFFVTVSCGTAMVTLNEDNPNLMQVAACFGFQIMCLAQFIGPLSGGHINCAVSFGLFVAGRSSWIRTLCYCFSQMLGSCVGAFFLWGIFGTNWPAARAFGSNSWDPSVFSGGQVFFGEMLGTMLLMYCVFATIDTPIIGGGPLGVFPIAMSVMVANLFLIPIDGCSINPTRSFGPATVAAWAGIVGNYYSQQYMFWFAPLFGAGLAALVYEYGALKPKGRSSKGDMADTIFMANLSRNEFVKGAANLILTPLTTVTSVITGKKYSNVSHTEKYDEDGHDDHGHDHDHGHEHDHDHSEYTQQYSQSPRYQEPAPVPARASNAVANPMTAAVAVPVKSSSGVDMTKSGYLDVDYEDLI